ncbi:MAG: NAD(P)H-hydrate epimerase [Planctomycetota bacterium]
MTTAETGDAQGAGPGDDREAGGAPRRLTRAEAAAVDRYAIEVLGLPGLVLMENAGLNAAGAVFDELRRWFVVDEGTARVAVVCGGGNNGGDGYVVARQLTSWGLQGVEVVAVKPVDELTGDAAVNAVAWTRLGGRVWGWHEQRDAAEAAVRGAHVAVDALLGTGYRAAAGPLRPATAAAVALLNERGEGDGRRVVCLDLPSGLDADTGAVAESGAVAADVTVSFVAEKAGFAAGEAGAYLGRVVLADIGLTAAAVAAALRWDRPEP